MKKFFGRLFRWLFRVFVILSITSLLYIIACKLIMPPITITQITNAFSYGKDQQTVGWNNISYNVKLAAIASEDQLFPNHGGFDWGAIEKSFQPKKGKRHKKAAGSAASTITQQTAKNVFLWQGSGAGKYLRKIPEAYFTKMIEWIWGKKRILEVYLNVIEMGPGIFGIEAAAQTYFHKPASNLSRQEAAMIIACLPNPKLFSVVPISKRVAWRYPQILKEMHNIEDDDDVQNVIQ